jgi:hypothetical protein
LGRAAVTPVEDNYRSASGPLSAMVWKVLVSA